MNELTTQPEVMYTPAKIELNNHEMIAELVKQAVKKYDGLVVTPETLAECKASRAELNKLIKALNKKRIDIHKEYEKPYNEFKEQIDGWTNELSVVVAQLKDGRKRTGRTQGGCRTVNRRDERELPRASGEYRNRQELVKQGHVHKNDEARQEAD